MIPSELVAAAAHGEPRAQEAVLGRTRPVVYRKALAWLGDRDLADDIAQTTLLKVLRGLPRLHDFSRYEAWAYRIMRNEILAHQRSERSRTRCLGQYSASATEAMGLDEWEPDLDDRRQARRVLQYLPHLPPAQRSAVRMVDVEGYRPCEAAAEMGKSLTTVRAGLCRGRQRLRVLFLAGRRNTCAKATATRGLARLPAPVIAFETETP